MTDAQKQRLAIERNLGASPQTPATKAQFSSPWTPCSREWFADLAKYRAGQGETPATDAVLAADTGDSSLIVNLTALCRKFEVERAAAPELLAALRGLMTCFVGTRCAANMIGPAGVAADAARAAIAKAQGPTQPRGERVKFPGLQS
jgi:hypothetical protein